MIDPASVPPVKSHELLARFVLYRGHIRSSAGTLKPDAFVPHPYMELSVTRLLRATDDELWAVGRAVASVQSKTLHGRGDIAAFDCEQQGLSMQPDPVDGNPNHANVTGWPQAKPEQKTIAQKLAAVVSFIRMPSPTE